MTTKRKPYVAEFSSKWWQKNTFYTWYFSREMTAVFAVWFCFILFWGFLSAGSGVESNAWNIYINFLKNPIVFVINIISFFAALLHSYTWFLCVPQVSPVKINGKVVETRKFALIADIVVVVLSVIILLCLTF